MEKQHVHDGGAEAIPEFSQSKRTGRLEHGATPPTSPRMPRSDEAGRHHSQTDEVILHDDAEAELDLPR